MTPKLVSIIIPTFNRARLVAEAIRSVQAQSYPAKQIIVIDDGSEDDTAQIVAQFTDVEYYRQENKGQAAARNLGLQYAEGEYIASLDSDDFWHEEFLTDGVNALEKHDLDFVFMNWINTDGNESYLTAWARKKKLEKFIASRDFEWFLPSSKQVRRMYVETCPSPTSSLLLRRSSLTFSWNEEMIIADDWFLILQLVLSKPCRAAFTLSPRWSKRVSGDNIFDGAAWIETTKNLGLHDERLMAEHFSAELSFRERHILRQRLARHHFNFGGLSWKHEGVSKNMLSGIVKAFALAPFGVSFYITEALLTHLKIRMKKRLSHKESEK